MTRPSALPLPAKAPVQAFAPPAALRKWGEQAAGLRALAGGDNVVTIFDAIGEDPWTGAGATAKSIGAQLRAIGERPVEVQINSPGGDVFEGIAIYNVLREHPQPITVKVLGLAASAASIIAMAGDRIEIGAASFLMVHNCWVLAMGNSADLRETADWLGPFDAALAAVYAQRSRRPAEECAGWMAAETWFSGQQAIDLGLADALLPADAVRIDEPARAEGRRVNDLRAMEIALMKAQGLSRSEARAKLNAIRGTTDSAPANGTPDAAEPAAWIDAARAFLAELRR